MFVHNNSIRKYREFKLTTTKKCFLQDFNYLYNVSYK